MLFPIPRITRRILLTDYAPEFVDHPDGKPVALPVWVNPPKAEIDAYMAAQASIRELLEKLKNAPAEDAPALAEQLGAAGKQTVAFYALVWGQSAEDIEALANDADNPSLYLWLCGRTWDEINDYRYTAKKKLTAP